MTRFSTRHGPTEKDYSPRLVKDLLEAILDFTNISIIRRSKRGRQAIRRVERPYLALCEQIGLREASYSFQSILTEEIFAIPPTKEAASDDDEG